MQINLSTFKGIRPKIDPELLPNEEAQSAINAKLSKGLLHPWHNELKEQDLNYNTMVRTIYLYEDQYWLEWTADVDVVLAPVSGDTAKRFYYTGDGIPKKSNLAEATTGSGAMPINFYPLGLPSPKHKPGVAAGGGGAGDPRDITYVWTTVSSWGEESLPSPASDVVAAKNGQTVSLDSMTLVWQASTAYVAGEFVIPSVANGYIYKCVTAGTTGADEPDWGTTVDEDTEDNTAVWRCYEDNISYKRIYRLNTGDQFGEYQYVTQIDAADTTYDDSTEDTDLGEVLPSAGWDPPIDELTGLTYMGNGILAGFNGKDLYFCEPYRPWAWPDDYRISLPCTVVAIASVGSTLVVVTELNPYLVTGTDPESMDPQPFPAPQPCTSKRSMKGYAGQVGYASPSGFVLISGSEMRLVTEGYYDSEEWAELHPETMHGHIQNNKYFGFYSSGGTEGCIVIDFVNNIITTLDLYVNAAYVDQETDTLYFCKHTSEVLLLEDGVAYSSRDGVLLLESGDDLLLE